MSAHVLTLGFDGMQCIDGVNQFHLAINIFGLHFGDENTQFARLSVYTTINFNQWKQS
jgi:hypothetical protein